MKRAIATIVVLILLCILSACHEGEYYDGYADGYSVAKTEMQNLMDEKFSDGYDIGYDDGYDDCEDDNDNAYNAGHSDGYYAGATYTCLFFGDVDRAFQSAHNGAAWDTFLDAYDQYISNIFDDDDTRSALFWALFSATSDDSVTAEEEALLIATFGEDLFTRNDIYLTD